MQSTRIGEYMDIKFLFHMLLAVLDALFFVDIIRGLKSIFSERSEKNRKNRGNEKKECRKTEGEVPHREEIG